VINIATDIENLGPINPGHTSLFKAKKAGNELTVVKVLPFSVRFNDEHYLYFKEALQKFSEVHREFGSSVPRAISSGITLTGSFPYVQMEFIEGLTLNELVKERQRSIFTIDELINLAERVSWTLLHCHNAGLIHGDVKDTTIRFNPQTSKYTLVGFGSCFLTGDQQQTYTKLESSNAFAAPEKREGKLFFETDVYQLGAVLYLLLTGKLPSSENEGNNFEQRVLAAREQSLLESWTTDKKEAEMAVPPWLLALIEKCLQQQPENRFYSGTDLYNNILFHHKFPVEKKVRSGGSRKKAPYSGIKTNAPKSVAVAASKAPSQTSKPVKKGGKNKNAIVVLAVVVFAALAFFYFRDKTPPQTYTAPSSNETTSTEIMTDTGEGSASSESPDETGAVQPTPAFLPPVRSTEKPQTQPKEKPEAKSETRSNNKTDLGAYKVRSKAYFHNQPNEQTRRAAFIVHWNNAVLRPLKEENDFVYIVFTNAQGQTSKGWLRKKDLIPQNQ